MRRIDKSWHQSTQTLINQIRKMTDCLLLTDLQTKLLLNLQMSTQADDIDYLDDGFIRFE